MVVTLLDDGKFLKIKPVSPFSYTERWLQRAHLGHRNCKPGTLAFFEKNYQLFVSHSLYDKHILVDKWISIPYFNSLYYSRNLTQYFYCFLMYTIHYKMFYIIKIVFLHLEICYGARIHSTLFEIMICLHLKYVQFFSIRKSHYRNITISIFI